MELTRGIFSIIVCLRVLEPGDPAVTSARRTLEERGRSGSRLAGGSTGDALPEAQLSMSRALRPHAEAAGRCACALRAHTICALSQCAGLWRAGCERRQCEGNRAEKRRKSAGGQWVCVRPNRGAGATSAADTRWGRSRKTRAKTGSQWLGSHGGVRRSSVVRVGSAGVGWTGDEARARHHGAPGLGPEWAARGQDPSSGRAPWASAAGGFLQSRLGPAATSHPAWKEGLPEWGAGSGFGVLCPTERDSGGFAGLGMAWPAWLRPVWELFCGAIGEGQGRVLSVPLYLWIFEERGEFECECT